MKEWLRRNTLVIQGLWFGVMFPVVLWAIGRITGWPSYPHPRSLLGFITYWLILGVLTGALYYGAQRFVASVLRRGAGG